METSLFCTGGFFWKALSRLRVSQYSSDGGSDFLGEVITQSSLLLIVVFDFPPPVQFEQVQETHSLSSLLFGFQSPKYLFPWNNFEFPSFISIDPVLYLICPETINFLLLWIIEAFQQLLLVGLLFDTLV